MLPEIVKIGIAFFLIKCIKHNSYLSILLSTFKYETVDITSTSLLKHLCKSMTSIILAEVSRHENLGFKVILN